MDIQNSSRQTDENGEKIDNIRFIFEVMETKLQQLFEASNELDKKISTITGFLATMIAGATLFFKDQLFLNFSPLLVSNYFTIGIISFIASVLCCIFALTSKKFYYPPQEDQLYSNESVTDSLYDLIDQTVADVKESFKKNWEIHEGRAKLFNYSLYFLLLGVILVFINFL